MYGNFEQIKLMRAKHGWWEWSANQPAQEMAWEVGFPHTWIFMSDDTKNQVWMLEHLHSVSCSTHVLRHRSSFVPEIVSGKRIPEGNVSISKFYFV